MRDQATVVRPAIERLRRLRRGPPRSEVKYGRAAVGPVGGRCPPGLAARSRWAAGASPLVAAGGQHRTGHRACPPAELYTVLSLRWLCAALCCIVDDCSAASCGLRCGSRLQERRPAETETEVHGMQIVVDSLSCEY